MPEPRFQNGFCDTLPQRGAVGSRGVVWGNRAWVGGLSLLMVVAFSVQVLDAATIQQASESARQTDRAVSIEAVRRHVAIAQRQREQPAAAQRLAIRRIAMRSHARAGSHGICRSEPSDRMSFALLDLPPPSHRA